MLEVKGLIINRGKKEVVKGIDLIINQGEIVGIVGPNGAGKSSLIKACAGVIKSSKGSIVCNDISIKDDIEKYIDNFQFCFDRAPFYPHLSGFENLMQVARIYGISREQVDEAIKIVGLEKRAKDCVKKYSFGMKQRLNIAQILVTKKQYIILDEPLNGIDPEGVALFRKIFSNMKEEYGAGILISSHLLGELKNICDRIVFMKNGEIVDEVNLKNQDVSTHVIRVNNAKTAYELLKGEMDISMKSNTEIVIESKGDLNDSLNILIRNNITVLGIESFNDVERIYINRVGGELND